MGTTADKLAAVAASKAKIDAALTARGITPPTRLADYGDVIRNLSRKAWDAEVQYLETDGTQYIDTGVVPGDNEVEWEFCFDWLTTTTTKSLFGARKTSGYGSGSYVLFSLTGNKLRLDCTGKTSAVNTGALSNPITVKYVAAKTTANGTDYTNYTKSSCEYSLLVGSVNTAGTAATSGLAPIRIRYCKIWKGGALVRDLVPVRSGSGANAVGYLFDYANGAVYGNAGTGAFTVGADKS